MNILDDPLYFGSYIGQHKIGKKSPMKDGYKGSGSDWKKYILQKGIHTEKVILRLCENVDEANYWENYYIEKVREEGIYLWNRYKGGGNHEYDRLYTDEELAEHQKQHQKQYREANKEKLAKYKKQYDQQHKEKLAKYKKQYDQQHKEYKKQYMKQYMKQYDQQHKDEIKERQKQYYEANKETIAEQKKQYREANKKKLAEYQKQYKNQTCQYNGEILTLNALSLRFRRAGIEYPTVEAKKYLIS